MKIKNKLIMLMLINAILSQSTIYASNLDDVKDKLNINNSNMNTTQNKIQNLKDKQVEVNSKVSQIEQRINEIQLNIDKENLKIQELEKDEKIKLEQLNKLKNQYEKNYDIFKSQLVSSYTNSFENNYSKVLFETKSLSDFLIGNTYFEYLLENKDTQLDNLNTNMENQEKLLKEIETNKKESQLAQSNLDKQRNNLENEQNEYNKEIQILQNDVNELEAILEAQSRESEKLTAQINELQNKLYTTQSNTTQSNNSNNSQSNNNSSNKNNSTGFGWPTKSRRVTSPYGYRIHPVSKVKKMHTGIDIGEGMGAGIYASNSGTVIYADWRGGYGKTVIIDHGNYISTLYAHLNSINVKTGQKVSKGQQIGTMGSTGVSTGPHLHFEIRKSGQHTSPMNYLK